MQIALQTKIGNCALDISAELKTDENAQKTIGENAMQYIVWHSVPSAAFDKKSEFKRNSEYSDRLAEHLVATIKTEFAKSFSNVVVKTEKWLKPDSAEKILKDIEKMSDEDFARIVAARKASKAAKIEPESEAEMEAA